MISGALSLRRDRDRVEQMIDAGMTFDQVEDEIEHFALSDAEKSALWLLAWSRLDRPRQAHIAEQAWVLVRNGV